MTNIVTSAKVKQYKDLMQATGPELSRLLDGILSGPFEHDTVNHGTHHVKCERCGEVMPLMERWDKREIYPCWVSPFDDLIPLTPAEAFKWRDWAVEKYGEFQFETRLADVIEDAGISTLYLGSYAQPEHYLKAVALCVLGDKK